MKVWYSSLGGRNSDKIEFQGEFVKLNHVMQWKSIIRNILGRRCVEGPKGTKEI